MRALLVLSVLLAAGCLQRSAEAPTPSTPAPAGTMTLTSGAFEDGAGMPRKHTCDGEAISPPLRIARAPGNASMIALLMLDGDVPIPQAPQREVVHWIWWNARLANDTLDVPEGGLAEGTVQGAGTAGAKYAGPCPPQGSTAHRYVLTAHAVDGALDLKEGATKDELVAALQDHSLATAKLTGLYARAIV